MKGSDLINKLINTTRIKLVNVLCENIIQQSEKELNDIFLQYLNVNHFASKDAEMFLKFYDNNEEKTFYLYERYNSIAKDRLGFQVLADYATLYFLKDLIKNKNHLYITIEEAVNIYINLTENLA